MGGAEELNGLRARLGGELPAGLSKLEPEELRDLEAAITEARRRQAAELQAASERAFGHIPRLLRRPIRKIMGSR